MYKMSWVLNCCLLMFLVQAALSQDDSDSGSDGGGCPPLKIKSVKIQCTSADGEEQDCLQPETGTKARIMWKKNVVQGSGTVTEVVCKDNGSWKRSAAGKSQGGAPSYGRKSGDSDDDSSGGSGKRSGSFSG